MRLESDATKEQRHAAWNELRDLFFPDVIVPKPDVGAEILKELEELYETERRNAIYNPHSGENEAAMLAAARCLAAVRRIVERQR